MKTSKRKPSRAAVQFFYENAGSAYNPAKETEEQGKRRGAIALARAEQWLSEQPGHTIEWLEDADYEPCQCGDSGCESPSFGWGCVVKVGDEQQSLWGIGFGGDGYPSGDTYARVVVAELALELMPS